MDRVDYQNVVIQDLINWEKNQELDLSPWYQRRSVWNNVQRSYLVNTLFEQKPIPALYIRHYLDVEREKSVKEVVDGQQRTRALISYCNNEFTTRHPEYQSKVLFRDLKRQHREKFLLTSIPVGVLLGATDEDVIDIFGRINSISKSLNAQEKRNAAYSGEMKQFCLREASSRINFWRTYNIFTTNDIARMNETQFISDVVLNLINGLSDFTAKKLDDLYKDYDEEFPQVDEVSERLDSVFDKIAALDPKFIRDTVFSRQPIFFSLVIALDQRPEISSKALGDAILEMDARFNSRDDQDPEDAAFYEASTSTTQRIARRRIRDEYIKRFLI